MTTTKTTMTRWRRPAAATLAVVAAFALFGAGVLTGRTGSPTSQPAAAVADQPSNVDVGFCQDMSAHHAQAVLMAEEALSRSTTLEIVTLAKEILTTQAQERGTMSGWLIAWHAPQLPSGPPMTWMSHQSHMPMEASMPGMASQPDLDRLATATGTAFDVLFLQLMMRHHNGGILMAEDARDHARLPEVRALAGAEVVDQLQENAVMSRQLSDDGGKPLPL